ncbi:visual pigment-like receptor peropsin [Dendronephthya gigantea]|uniref:visual pigment-like receptor peropsin n=1 Tax=Dendronephthya gigantea TaxID=151771 RepID=UPI001069DD3E|nr:visual pigment-like receptor peropsin [Dendronephthya gigantea]
MTISKGGSVVLAFSYAIIALFGSVSNGLVALTYLKWRSRILTQPKDVLILSLAIGDFVMSTIVCPLGFASAVNRKWTSGHTGCVFYGFFSTWIGLASIAQLAFHAIERYVTLSSPIPNVISVKRAFQIIMAAWIGSFLASCFPLLGWSQYTFEGFGLHCSILWDSRSAVDSSYSMFLLIVFFTFPVAAIAFSYGKIFFIVRRIYLNADTMWGHDAQATKESYEAQVKTAKQLLLMIAGFMFAWTPYAVMSFIVVFFGGQIPFGYHEYPSLFAKTSNIYNPIIYFFTYQSLREKAIGLLQCRGNVDAVEPMTNPMSSGQNNHPAV